MRQDSLKDNLSSQALGFDKRLQVFGDYRWLTHQLLNIRILGGKQAAMPIGMDLTTNRRTVEYPTAEFRRVVSLCSVFFIK